MELQCCSRHLDDDDGSLLVVLWWRTVLGDMFLTQLLMETYRMGLNSKVWLLKNSLELWWTQNVEETWW